MCLADAIGDFTKRNGRDPSDAEREGLSRRRHGGKACVGLETLLTGAPRPHSLIAKSQHTALMEISRRELAKCLALDDASRAKEHALKVTRAYNEAKRNFVEKFGSRGASWGEDAAGEEGAEAYRAGLVETPPPPTAREALFRAEAARQMSLTPGFEAIEDEEERRMMVQDFYTRVEGHRAPPRARFTERPVLRGGRGDAAVDGDVAREPKRRTPGSHGNERARRFDAGLQRDCRVGSAAGHRALRRRRRSVPVLRADADAR